ncbi:hypothetical protein [Yokenella regensburgei]|uniref:hypothetical protein n=1 Tax=Yokenella regensburgei TaxID=158877 RepID=UPI0013761CD3|nr:hypothetical protein [Yokenella regensburgei]KAF1366398.1 hypothetical protein FHR25_005136 [Yokenella regensburgei]
MLHILLILGLGLICVGCFLMVRVVTRVDVVGTGPKAPGLLVNHQQKTRPGWM